MTLLYYYACLAKRRRVIFDCRVDEVMIELDKEISKRYNNNVLEIEKDSEHFHDWHQSVPMLFPAEIVHFIKRITAKEICRSCSYVKKKLWDGDIGVLDISFRLLENLGNES